MSRNKFLGGKNMKKVFGIGVILVCAVVLLMSSCTGKSGGSQSDDLVIGIAMPTHSDESWLRHTAFIRENCEKLGYTKFDEQWAEDVVSTQVSQIENMITKGVDVLIVAAVDGSALTDVLAKAASQGIKVIAYDRLIMNTPNVDCYITFDNFKVGVAEAGYIEEKLDLKNKSGPFYIELFGGSADDNNSYFFYNGAMDVLQPYIDSGKVIVKSGQFGIEKTGIQNWDGAVAQARMDNLLVAYYADGTRLDAVLSPYDGLSIGIISSLKNVGYGTAARPLPIVTGQDAEVASVISIVNGEQTQTVWKDFRKPGEICARMVDALLKGTEIPINDTSTYDNGVKVVPSYLCDVQSIDVNNYMDLFTSGFYDKTIAPWNDIIK
jgi:putative multiple sugar transport system substrate-binding protein